MSEYREFHVPSDGIATTCTFSLWALIELKEGKDGMFNTIKSELTKQSKPIKISFFGLNTDTPTMKWTARTVEINKLLDNSELIILSEKTNFSINLFTYSPKKQVMIYSIQDKKITWWAKWEQLMWFCE